jgi:hypothetical protein
MKLPGSSLFPRAATGEDYVRFASETLAATPEATEASSPVR